MKLLPCLLIVLLAACAQPVASFEATPGPAPASIRCELLGLELSDDESATASFRVTNESGTTLAYTGYAPDGPLYGREVLEADVWQESFMGWCGTGASEYELAPGKSITFTAFVPRDGKRYRFRIGEPPVVTPPVSAAPK